MKEGLIAACGRDFAADQDHIRKSIVCSPLLPPPGGEVVKDIGRIALEAIAELLLRSALHAEDRKTLEGLTDIMLRHGFDPDDCLEDWLEKRLSTADWHRNCGY